MGRPHPMALRERVVACVEEGYSHRTTATRFRVSVKFVNDMIILKRETGGLVPRMQGNGGGHGKLEAMKASIGKRMTEKPDLTLDDLVTELAERHGITIHRVSVWRFPARWTAVRSSATASNAWSVTVFAAASRRTGIPGQRTSWSCRVARRSPLPTAKCVNGCRDTGRASTSAWAH